MQNMPTFSAQTPFSSNTETCSMLRNYYVDEIWLWDGFEQGQLSCCDIDFPVTQLFCAESKVSFCLFFYSIIFKEDMRWVYLFLLLFPVCSVRSSLNPFIVSSTHKVYTRNQQCRSTLQLRTRCAWVLHCRSLPTYFKLLYLLSHSSNLIRPYICQSKDNWME